MSIMEQINKYIGFKLELSNEELIEMGRLAQAMNRGDSAYGEIELDDGILEVYVQLDSEILRLDFVEALEEEEEKEEGYSEEEIQEHNREMWHQIYKSYID